MDVFNDYEMLYNASVDHVGNDSANTTSSHDTAVGATIISPITMFLAGVIGNLLALVVLYRTKTEIRRMMFYTLVAGLAITDLAGIILTSPVTISAYINQRRMPGGDGLCTFNAFIMVCFGLSTPLIVCAMAVERFLAIKCTYFYSKHCTPNNARITIVLLWMFVFLFGALPLFGFGQYSLQYPHTWCFLNFRTPHPVNAAYGYMYAGVNLCIVVLMTVCNVVVMLSLLRVRYLRREQGRNSLSGNLLQDSVDESRMLRARARKQKQHDVEMQMVVLMCVITTTFAVCWAPLMIYITITLATGASNPVFGLVAVRLASLNQTLDPWLYILLRKAFLKRIKCKVQKFFCPVAPVKEFSECKCREYVHVRNQLFHRNVYVGNKSDPQDQSSSQNTRRSPCQPFQENQQVSLPDVMKDTDTGKAESLPDVTKPRSSEVNNAFNMSSSSDVDVVESPDGIYVDIFKLVPPIIVNPDDQSSGRTSEECFKTDETSGVVQSGNGGTGVVIKNMAFVESSTSGVFSLTRSGQNETVGEVTQHSDITPVNPVTKLTTRRTKSYT
ncbi:prostaglandin E2 receptor EP4 subtype-like [Gigantopelta aegis]|uniref:prostaglandin E2 receptor EP4 subtype-like n=1 Tax=Gigantopelta aegis TaxID=1735272 RepID=UPI001B88B6DB|nr:prostaglandin E2 receptor EP4 subtype-like [Gigantopelta aegis]